MTGPPVRVEKRKWDGSLAAVVMADLVSSTSAATVWHVAVGTERERPRAGTADVVDRDELWVGVPGEWWVLCAHLAADRSVDELVLHAAAPFDDVGPELIRWIDLDLDFEVRGEHVSLEDEAEFHAHARTMAYPDDVVRGAWAGISGMAARYTTREWPFDGFLDDLLR
jgi:protein associated with RNAse G/E